MTSGARHRTRACQHRDANRWLQETMGHCFRPVIYNEKTYQNVWRRKRPARSASDVAANERECFVERYNDRAARRPVDV